MQIKLGAVVIVLHKSDGTGALKSVKTPYYDHVSRIYTDGAVMLQRSKEVWKVIKKANVLVTTMQQRRVD